MSIVTYNKQLISEVKKYPIIFNQKHENYKNDKLRNETWDIISSTLKVKTEEVIRRWKNLRDRYLRIKKIIISTGDEGYKKHGNWPYLEDLSFLQEFTFHRSTKALPTKSKVKRKYFNENEMNRSIARHWLSVDDGNNTDEEDFYQIDPTAYLMVKQEPTGDYEPFIKRTKYENCENQNFETFTNASPRKDEDELFCQSIFKSLQRFSPQPRAYAKLGIQKVLYETELYANSLYKMITETTRKSASI